MNLQRFDQILKARAVGAVVFTAAFVGVTVYALWAGTLMGNPTPSIILMVVAYFLIPRRALPKDYKPETDEEVALVEVRDGITRKLQTARLTFFVVAVLLLALVPFLMGEPVFRTS